MLIERIGRVQEPRCSSPPIWIGEILNIEPKLADLAAAVRRGEICEWDRVVARAASFVGALARRPRLRRADAWRCAIAHLRSAFDRRDRQGCRRIGEVITELLPRYGFTPAEIAAATGRRGGRS